MYKYITWYQLLSARHKNGTAQWFRQANSARIFTNLCWYYIVSHGTTFSRRFKSNLLQSRSLAALLDKKMRSIPYVGVKPKDEIWPIRSLDLMTCDTDSAMHWLIGVRWTCGWALNQESDYQLLSTVTSIFNLVPTNRTNHKQSREFG